MLPVPIVKYLNKFVTYFVQKKRSVTSKVSQAWRNISTDDEETPERKFTLKNSLWFGIASLLQQGGDIPIRWGLKKKSSLKLLQEMGRLLLRNGHFQCLQEPVNPASGGSVVVLHFDHHFVLYGQPGGALDRQENGIPHQGCI